MNWIKQIYQTDSKWISYSLILLIITCHVTIFGASLAIVLSYLTLFIYWISKKKIVSVSNPAWLGYLLFFTFLLLADVLSDNSSDSVRLFFQKRLPLWSIGLILPIAFHSVDDVRQLIKAFLVFGVLTSFGSIIYFVLVVSPSDPNGGRLLMFTHYMTSGGMTMMLSLLLFSFVINPNTTKKWRIYTSIGLLICITALVLTSTRSSWLGFLLGASIISIIVKKEILYILIVSIVLFFFLAPQSVQDRIESIWNPNHPNNVGRLHMWETGIEIWKDNKWFGVGDHDLKAVYAKYKKADDTEEGGHLHNTLVMWLVTTGIFGITSVLAFIGFLFYGLIRTLKQSETELEKSVTIGVLACFSGFLLNGLFEWNFGDSEIVTYISILLGLCWIIYNDQQKRKLSGHVI